MQTADDRADLVSSPTVGVIAEDTKIKSRMGETQRCRTYQQIPDYTHLGRTHSRRSKATLVEQIILSSSSPVFEDNRHLCAGQYMERRQRARLMDKLRSCKRCDVLDCLRLPCLSGPTKAHNVRRSKSEGRGFATKFTTFGRCRCDAQLLLVVLTATPRTMIGLPSILLYIRSKSPFTKHLNWNSHALDHLT